MLTHRSDSSPASGPRICKPTRSGNSANCVELATPGGPFSYVRDSKDPEGPALILTDKAYAAFIGAAAAGEFDFGFV
ncbi:DUF397 domain-containing protein [Kitasatospora sp. NPDC093806]|uniref:DUF397 domain-containing protein n=1 Tax=Kitasatospora sp. NPDC093806 TaxID=3155075 RepID=UPI003447FBEF